MSRDIPEVKLLPHRPLHKLEDDGLNREPLATVLGDTVDAVAAANDESGLVALFAPWGSGKSTVINFLSASRPGVVRQVRAWTVAGDHFEYGLAELILCELEAPDDPDKQTELKRGIRRAHLGSTSRRVLADDARDGQWKLSMELVKKELAWKSEQVLWALLSAVAAALVLLILHIASEGPTVEKVITSALVGVGVLLVRVIGTTPISARPADATLHMPARQEHPLGIPELLASEAVNAEEPKDLRIVVIDDLDRCAENELVTALGRLRHLHVLKNVVYVVPLDEAHASRAWDKVHAPGTGALALAKLFDAVVRLPEPSWRQRQALLNEQLRALGIEDARVRLVIERGALDQPRLMKRVLNSLSIVRRTAAMRLGQTRTQRDLPLLALLVVLQERWPTVYDEIERDPFALFRLQKPGKYERFAHENVLKREARDPALKRLLESTSHDVPLGGLFDLVYMESSTELAPNVYLSDLLARVWREGPGALHGIDFGSEVDWPAIANTLHGLIRRPVSLDQNHGIALTQLYIDVCLRIEAERRPTDAAAALEVAMGWGLTKPGLRPSAPWDALLICGETAGDTQKLEEQILQETLDATLGGGAAPERLDLMVERGDCAGQFRTEWLADHVSRRVQGFATKPPKGVDGPGWVERLGKSPWGTAMTKEVLETIQTQWRGDDPADQKAKGPPLDLRWVGTAVRILYRFPQDAARSAVEELVPPFEQVANNNWPADNAEQELAECIGAALLDSPEEHRAQLAPVFSPLIGVTTRQLPRTAHRSAGALVRGLWRVSSEKDRRSLTGAALKAGNNWSHLEPLVQDWLQMDEAVFLSTQLDALSQRAQRTNESLHWRLWISQALHHEPQTSAEQLLAPVNKPEYRPRFLDAVTQLALREAVLLRLTREACRWFVDRPDPPVGNFIVTKLTDLHTQADSQLLDLYWDTVLNRARSNQTNVASLAHLSTGAAEHLGKRKRSRELLGLLRRTSDKGMQRALVTLFRHLLLVTEHAEEAIEELREFAVGSGDNRARQSATDALAFAAGGENGVARAAAGAALLAISQGGSDQRERATKKVKRLGLTSAN